MKNIPLVLLVALLACGTWYAFRFNEPQLCAQIADAAGQPLPKVAVRILRDTAMVATRTTDEKGKFCVSLLPGVYTVEITHSGFAQLRLEGVPVKAAQKTNLHTVVLQPTVATLTESITVYYRPALFAEADYDEAPIGERPILRPAAERGKLPVVAPPKSRRAEDRAAYRSISESVSERSKTDADGEAPALRMAAPAAEGVALEKATPQPVEGKGRVSRPGRTPAAQRAGTLTAGEWNDLYNWNHHWADLLRDGEIDSYQKTYQLFPQHRYSVLLQNEKGMPLSDVPVHLLDRAGAILWEARTCNTGQAELWAGLFSGKLAEEPFQVAAYVDGKRHVLGTPRPFASGLNRYQIQRECHHPKTVDIVWTVDATGSMGDEIDYLKTELLDVIGRVQERFPDLDVRMGAVFYRDEGDEYLVKSSALNRDISKTVSYIQAQYADGGGDYPEAVHSALEETLRQPWSREAVARICFLVLDASPHQRPEVIQSLQRSIREAARRGIRIVPIACSGIQKDTEFLMKFFGLATNGSYIFLTDHSGVGGKHLAPTADVYKVELLNDLLVRLIGEYVNTPRCDDGKLPMAFHTQPDPQSPVKPTQAALYYPNPASDQLTIEIPFDAQKVTLYNAEGLAARDLGALPAGVHAIAVQDLPPGTYTLRIWRGSEIQSGKVLVVRT